MEHEFRDRPRRPGELIADCEKTQAPIGTRDYNLTEGCGTASRPYSDEEIVAELFKYHPPNAETLPKYAAINQAAKNFAEIVLQNCPRSADRSAAIRLIRDARMTANASVALNGLSL
jgi:hypothetical protein